MERIILLTMVTLRLLDVQGTIRLLKVRVLETWRVKSLGATCCNKTLRFAISRTLHESSHLDFSKMDTNEVSRVSHCPFVSLFLCQFISTARIFQALARSAQSQFQARVETVVSRGNFIWNSPGARETDITCKLDLFQFHALIFQTDLVKRTFPSRLFNFSESTPRRIYRLRRCSKSWL